MNNAFSSKLRLLRVEVATTDKGKSSFKIINSSEVMAIEVSVTRSEFYQSKVAGFKVSKVVKINSFLYKNERFIEMEGTIYQVVRTYNVAHLIELTLEKTNYKEANGWLI